MSARDSDWSRDTLFDGRLIICQQRRGYRFSLDAILLSGLSRIGPQERVVDLGTGCGVIPLIMAARGQGKHWVALEVQPELVQLARHNVCVNDLAHVIDVMELDLRSVPYCFRAGQADVVVSNPPYRRVDSGRISPCRQRAVARHEIAATLEDVVKAAHHLLPAGGRFEVIYTATRLDDLFVVLVRYGLRPKRMTLIHTDRYSPATLVHLLCRKDAGGELQVTPPFTIYTPDGDTSEQMAALYRLDYQPGAGF